MVRPRTQRAFAERLANEIDERGAVDVLRHGVKDRGLLFGLAYFRPAHTLADDALVQDEENRLSVTPQRRYSTKEPERSVARRPGVSPGRGSTAPRDTTGGGL